ncbi:hypothetical protein [Halobellus captivus]|uniref:hypothetical protein n=1 Tax=Halobellus captivus TaxID=2592614 RepID=UPI0011A63CAC|nr:hypothetical protein [Halobellus captivus]
MKRRQVITAIGTLSLGAGTALGTGAFDATSSNSSGGLSVVTQTENADINIVPGWDEFTTSNLGDDLYVPVDGEDPPEYIASDGTISYEKLSREDLPVAVVQNSGYGMATVQIAVEVGRPETKVDFASLLAVNNNDSQDYELGFTYYQGYGTPVDDEEISAGVVNDTFIFEAADGTRISPLSSDSEGAEPANLMTIDAGTTEPVSLSVNTDQSDLTEQYADVYGNNYDGAGSFVSDGDGATTEELVSEVTAVANELTSFSETAE